MRLHGSLTADILRAFPAVPRRSLVPSGPGFRRSRVRSRAQSQSQNRSGAARGTLASLDPQPHHKARSKAKIKNEVKVKSEGKSKSKRAGARDRERERERRRGRGQGQGQGQQEGAEQGAATSARLSGRWDALGPPAERWLPAAGPDAGSCDRRPSFSAGGARRRSARRAQRRQGAWEESGRSSGGNWERADTRPHRPHILRRHGAAPGLLSGRSPQARFCPRPAPVSMQTDVDALSARCRKY